MTRRKLNWQIWAGAFFAFIAFLSYPLFFANFPVTRDFPWANLLLTLLAAVLIFLGVRKEFSGGRGWLSKAGSLILAGFGTLSIGLFIFIAFVMATWLPSSVAAPQVGSEASDFALADTNGKPISLSQLLADKKGVLLVFYRGYW